MQVKVNSELNGLNIGQEDVEFNNTEIQERNLHEDSSLDTSSEVSIPITNTEVNNILQLARPILSSVITQPGDFSNRVTDTRAKNRPTNGDISGINGAIEAPSGQCHRSNKRTVCLSLVNELYTVLGSSVQKKQKQEARELNRKFQLDPGSVCIRELRKDAR